MKSLLSFCFLLCLSGSFAQYTSYVVPHDNDTIYGEIKSKNGYGGTFYRLTYKDDQGKKIKKQFSPNEIASMRQGHTFFTAKWIDQNEESSLFNEALKRKVKDFYVWRIEFTSVGMSMPTGFGGSVTTSNSSFSYYLEAPDSQVFVEEIPTSRKAQIEFFQSKGCPAVVKALENKEIDPKNPYKSVELFADKCYSRD